MFIIQSCARKRLIEVRIEIEGGCFSTKTFELFDFKFSSALIVPFLQAPLGLHLVLVFMRNTGYLSHLCSN